MKKDELQRLRELEAEVKAEFEVKDARRREREEEERRRREERLRAAAEEQAQRKEALVRRKRDDEDDDSALDAFRDRVGGTSGALDIAHQAKGELEGKRTGEKSLLISGGVSMIFGPLGWLYAGSWREAIPASLLYLLIGGLVSKILPSFLFLPILMVVLPVSGIAGMVYAWQYNRNGERTRLFDKDDDES